MYPLFLQFNSTDILNLDGQDPGETVIRSCKVVPAAGVASPRVDNIAVERLELILEGSTSEITTKIASLEHYISLAALEPTPHDWLFLHYYTPGVIGGEPPYDWHSRILSGWLELAGKGLVDRDNESQQVNLHITRLDYWSAPKAQLNSYSNISSHTDDEHVNAFSLSSVVMEGDLPAPVELQIEGLDEEGSFPDFVISQRLIPGKDPLYTGFVEAEDLTAGSDVTMTTPADAGSSGGAYAVFDWTGEDETLLGYWTPDAADLALMRGQAHRPILRLHSVNDQADLWMRVKVHSTSSAIIESPAMFENVLQESLWMLIPTNTLFVELPPVNIPPNAAKSDLFRPLYVSISARRPSGGSSSLEVDFVQFTPVQTVRRLSQLNLLAMPTGPHIYLVDSGIDLETYYIDLVGTREVSHVGQGNFLQLVPGYTSIIRVQQRPLDEVLTYTDALFNFYVWYEPRRRTL
jgi:hypothetical protein